MNYDQAILIENFSSSTIKCMCYPHTWMFYLITCITTIHMMSLKQQFETDLHISPLSPLRCLGSDMKETPVCKDVGIDETVEFQVEISARECPAKRRQVI